MIYDAALTDAQVKRLAGAAPLPTRALFDTGYHGARSYRIPSLLTLDSGVILAGADQRVSIPNDAVQGEQGGDPVGQGSVVAGVEQSASGQRGGPCQALDLGVGEGGVVDHGGLGLAEERLPSRSAPTTTRATGAMSARKALPGAWATW